MSLGTASSSALAHAALGPPQYSLLLLNYDMAWTAVRYAQECEGARSDVTSINLRSAQLRDGGEMGLFQAPSFAPYWQPLSRRPASHLSTARCSMISYEWFASHAKRGYYPHLRFRGTKPRLRPSYARVRCRRHAGECNG